MTDNIRIKTEVETNDGCADQSDDVGATLSSGDNVTQQTSPACSYCKKLCCKHKAEVKGQLKIHTERPYTCDVCGKEFLMKSYLRLHVRRAHSAEKPHVCDVCGKHFHSRSVLKRHCAEHTKPFTCDLCTKRFSTNSYLRDHVKTVHVACGGRRKRYVTNRSRFDSRRCVPTVVESDCNAGNESTYCKDDARGTVTGNNYVVESVAKHNSDFQELEGQADSGSDDNVPLASIIRTVYSPTTLSFVEVKVRDGNARMDCEQKTYKNGVSFVVDLSLSGSERNQNGSSTSARDPLDLSESERVSSENESPVTTRQRNSLELYDSDVTNPVNLVLRPEASVCKTDGEKSEERARLCPNNSVRARLETWNRSVRLSSKHERSSPSKFFEVNGSCMPQKIGTHIETADQHMALESFQSSKHSVSQFLKLDFENTETTNEGRHSGTIDTDGGKNSVNLETTITHGCLFSDSVAPPLLPCKPNQMFFEGTVEIKPLAKAETDEIDMAANVAANERDFGCDVKRKKKSVGDSDTNDDEAVWNKSKRRRRTESKKYKALQRQVAANGGSTESVLKKGGRCEAKGHFERSFPVTTASNEKPALTLANLNDKSKSNFEDLKCVVNVCSERCLHGEDENTSASRDQKPDDCCKQVKEEKEEQDVADSTPDDGKPFFSDGWPDLCFKYSSNNTEGKSDFETVSTNPILFVDCDVTASGTSTANTVVKLEFTNADSDCDDDDKDGVRSKISTSFSADTKPNGVNEIALLTPKVILVDCEKEARSEQQLVDGDFMKVQMKETNSSDECARSKTDLVKCEVCLKPIRSKHLPVHIGLHAQDTPFECKGCHSKSALCKHSVSHSSKRGKALKVNQGMRNVHNTETKQYICEICGKTYSLRKTRDIHQDRHNRRKYFQCDVCKLELSDKTSLKTHIRTMHVDRFRLTLPKEEFPETVTESAGVAHKVDEEVVLSRKVECGNNSDELNSPKRAFSQSEGRNDDVKRMRCIGEAILSPTRQEKNPAANKLQSQKSHGVDGGNDDDDVVRTDEEESKLRKKIECGVCFKVIQVKFMKSHLTMHDSPVPLRCDTCGKICKNELKLRSHLITHSDERNFSCLVCEKKFKRKHFVVDHMRFGRCPGKPPVFADAVMTPDESGLILQCATCHKPFGNSYELRRHVLSHSEERNFSCAICGKSFKRKDALKVHTKALHDDELDDDHPLKSSAGSDDQSRKVECPVCSKFIKAKFMESHVKIHTSDTPLQCETCGKNCNTEFNLRKHQLSHSDDHHYTCELCGKTFKRSHSLDEHMKYRHSEDRPFSCDTCGKAFPVLRALTKHKTNHDPDRSFACNVCGASLPSLYRFRQHKKTHCGNADGAERVYRCGICCKTYTKSVSYHYHLKSVHSEWKHKCEICEKPFLYPTNLKRHMRIHCPDYIETSLDSTNPRSEETKAKIMDRERYCDHCQIWFPNPTALKIHRKEVNGGTRYICDVCGKEFYARNTLIIHSRIHTGETPYECHICNKAFMYTYARNVHLRQVHGMDLSDKDKPLATV